MDVSMAICLLGEWVVMRSADRIYNGTSKEGWVITWIDPKMLK